ncbi:serine hydrolase domain-containing protein [Flavitalea sp. BT771]|nr:serine hydrolase domain-containing protein [Flavitalea sp. BT771]MDV6223727.1 serine hydrolase domain-containing protein [Flavitalea sp. BT771]
MLLKNTGIAILFVLVASAGRAQRTDKLDQWMEDHVKEMGGRAMLAVWKDGKLVYSQSANEMTRKQKMVNKFIARRQKKEADLSDYTMSTRQPIASCSKWLSAALVMTFVDEGKLQLSDTVGKYLPVLSAHGKGMITVRQCLSHLTGINEPPLKESLKDLRKVGSMDEAMEYIAKMPMEGTPGEVFHYSNAGLQIAGAIIEKIGGASFEELFAERIARPLDMKDTDFGKGRVALPAGGASSTPEDYLNFLVMILGKGVFQGHRILSESSVAAMEKDRIDPDVRVAYSPVPMAQIGYGYGEWVVRPEGTTVTSPGLFGSVPWVDNEKGYCAFLMAFYIKRDDREARFRELKQLVDASL